MKQNYEEWKEEYCAKITEEVVQDLKSLHDIENPEELIEKYNQEAYQKYLSESWKRT